MQLTVKSVTFFAKQKNAPLFTSADAGVSCLRRKDSTNHRVALKNNLFPFKNLLKSTKHDKFT